MDITSFVRSVKEQKVLIVGELSFDERLAVPCLPHLSESMLKDIVGTLNRERFLLSPVLITSTQLTLQLVEISHSCSLEEVSSFQNIEALIDLVYTHYRSNVNRIEKDYRDIIHAGKCAS